MTISFGKNIAMETESTISQPSASDDCSECPVINMNHVQIKADKKEINRRISSFIKRKRMEVDELNLQEFCNRPRADLVPEDSCARIDAVLVKRAGGKSHIKVSKVVNQWGPQTNSQWSPNESAPLMGPLLSRTSPNLPEISCRNSAINERLFAMESHLKLSQENLASKDVYERLKNLENRILFLEGISPEYFSTNPKALETIPPSFERTDQFPENDEDMSLSTINSRISELKKLLHVKRMKT